MYKSFKFSWEQRSGFIFRHLKLKRSHKMFITEYITVRNTAIIKCCKKCNPLVTKAGSETNSNKRKTIYFF